MPEDIDIHTGIQDEVTVGIDEIDKDDYLIFINFYHERMDLTLAEAIAVRNALNTMIWSLMNKTVGE